MFQFNIFNTKVELHYFFFILLLIVAFSGSVTFAAASAVFSFLHELVHKTTAVKLGYIPEKISFGLFGGVLHLRDGFIKPVHELFIYLSGPFFNILIAFLLYGFYLYFYIPWLEPVIIANTILALFNLMPFYPLDGGKIADLYLAIFLGYGRSQKISRIFSLFFIIFLFLLGIYLVQYNVLNLFLSALAINLYIARKQDNSFIFYKITRNIEDSDKNGSEKIVVCKEDVKAIKIIERNRPMESRIITIVSDKGKYKGQLTETELLDGIYYCGIYADFKKLLDFKRSR
ncbi:MAG: site-2 protease family protein [Eubacteriaceae bacterium]